METEVKEKEVLTIEQDIPEQANIVETEDDDKQTIGEKVGTAVDEAIEFAEKGAEFVGDAAKIAVEFADTQLKQAKSVFSRIGKELAEAKAKKNREKFGPVFYEDLEAGRVEFPNMISIMESDKSLDIEECKGAIGFQKIVKDVPVLGIIQKEVDKYDGLQFYPDVANSVYYVHPFQENKYIEMSHYFTYLKEAKVAELDDIAQKLGAKHFSVKIMEAASSKDKKKIKAYGKLGLDKHNKAEVGTEHSSEESDYKLVKIESEQYYDGKAPELPKLVFWANNESVKMLVKQRMDTSNMIRYKRYVLDFNTSSGIKGKDAAKIDGVLKAMKFKAAGSIEEAVEQENRRKFEFIIEF